MKVCGFTFIRNALKYDYPIEEAIRSVLPLCDDFVVAVGNSEDETKKLIEGIAPGKIRVIDTVWDDSLRQGGEVLAKETDKAYQAVPEDADWAFYIQGDEVVHEKYYPAIEAGMRQWKDHPTVDGLLFGYQHFYGSYDYIGISSKWYRHEIRIIRKRKDIFSYRDAQGFRKGNNQKLSVKPLDAEIYHYGYVRHPQAMKRKEWDFHKYWHDDAWIQQNVVSSEDFEYGEIDALSRFVGSHPKVMQKRIEAHNWHFDYDLSKNSLSFKDRIKYWIEKTTGWRPGEYQNYRLI